MRAFFGLMVVTELKKVSGVDERLSEFKLARSFTHRHALLLCTTRASPLMQGET